MKQNKDLLRQNRIQEKLKCYFIIIYDNYNGNKIEKFNYNNKSI